MTKDEYTKRLELILSAYKETSNAGFCVTAIQQLNNEAIGVILEAGFGIPKVGTPDHDKGIFTKLISAQELRNILGASND